jgi:long-chain acyl-CoA synthetase
MTISSLSVEDHLTGDDEVLASAGSPRTDIEVRIIDADDRAVPPGEIGEVAVRGDVVMVGT